MNKIFCVCRLIQEEKESTEQRAEELESRVGSGSLEALAGRWLSEPRSPSHSGPTTPTTLTNTPSDLHTHHTVSLGGLLSCWGRSLEYKPLPTSLCGPSPFYVAHPLYAIVIVMPIYRQIVMFMDYGSINFCLYMVMLSVESPPIQTTDFVTMKCRQKAVLMC